jgi:hypothetical protein
MTGIIQPSDFFILFRLQAEDSIDLVVQERWRSTFLIANLAEDVGRRDVDRLDRIWHQQFGDFQCSSLAGSWFG